MAKNKFFVRFKTKDKFAPVERVIEIETSNEVQAGMLIHQQFGTSKHIDILTIKDEAGNIVYDSEKVKEQMEDKQKQEVN